MGKADFKKVNDNWCGDEANRAALDKFFDEAAQDKPSTGKKNKKIKPKKADHKHDYEQVLVKYEDFNAICIADKCRICGKIGNVKTGTCIRIENGLYRQLTNEEVLEQYSHLPFINGGKFF